MPSKKTLKRTLMLKKVIKRRATFAQDSDLFCDSWGLPPTMTDKDSDNLITDNKEPEVISVKQNIEARGERLKQDEETRKKMPLEIMTRKIWSKVGKKLKPKIKTDNSDNYL